MQGVVLGFAVLCLAVLCFWEGAKVWYNMVTTTLQGNAWQLWHEQQTQQPHYMLPSTASHQTRLFGGLAVG